ncbi:putative NADPH--cytochrome P450 reductase [Mariannaea sp. PMI_226]|nr:putative NADPH--cytochrome P450 reductase [Mariannaea sp. PMI_226]
MTEISSTDWVVVGFTLLLSFVYLKGAFKAPTIPPYVAGIIHANGLPKKSGSQVTRDIVERLKVTGKNCVLFYGTQTGTAEDYVARLAKEGSQRFGLKTLIADLADYDFECFESFPEDKFAIFVMATYGEGEPTDNAIGFFNYINREDIALKLSSLRYVAFGLGNSMYEHYNATIRNMDTKLTQLGAQRIGSLGTGDDGAGTLEEDFLAWREDMWATVAKAMNLDERDELVYEPLYSVTEDRVLSLQHESVYLGEPTEAHLNGSQKRPFSAHNPYIATITESRELFAVKDRHCLHLEIQVNSELSYHTGDHIAIWPTNAGREVDRFLSVFGLLRKRDQVINIESVDATAKVPFPTPTTYDAAVSYYMEICAPVSRQFIASLAQFAPDEVSKKELVRLGNNKEYFRKKVTEQRYNIAQTLQTISQKAFSVPFSLLIEGVHRLQPRYYSISSSSLVQKDRISITAVVESLAMPGYTVKGVTTNYLLALKQRQNNEPTHDPYCLTYTTGGPRQKYINHQIPVHIRHSHFKLPADASRPIIMIGPGSGVAPFRGFIQERAALAARGEKVGISLLFFGCRNRNEDFLYKEEWKVFEEKLGATFKLFTAFSREGKAKVYVQHRLLEQSVLVNQLLRQGAIIYICGDAANMARAVHKTLGEIIANQRGLTTEQAEEVIKELRQNGGYQEDVWQ